MGHPLHLAVANKVHLCVGTRAELIRDPACGGNQQLPLFIGRRKGRETRMCCVDLLVVESGQLRVIVEIEESGFLPTKICGKLLQAALADHFIHDTRSEVVLPYAEEVLFVQVLDGSKCLKPGSRKDAQAELIEKQIRDMLPLGRITDYHLIFVVGPDDQSGLTSVVQAVSSALA